MNTAIVELPGEGGAVKALGFAWFPSRMHAFVFRNWGCVPAERMAEVTGATPGKLAALARAMGLPPQGAIPEEWRTHGYVTVIRQNWHLLSYDQIMRLVGWSRERMRYHLLEEDFLFHRLGMLKPQCEELVWEDGVLALPFEAVEEAGMLGTGEARFAFVRELAEQNTELRTQNAELDASGGTISCRGEPMCSPGQTHRSAPTSSFGLRMIFSYFADCGEPLLAEGVPSYPEGLVQKLAAQGANALWCHACLRNMAKDAAFPEFGEGCEQRLEGLRCLVARAKEYGMEVILYLNEPRAMPPSFFEAAGREGMRGVATPEGNFRMCTSSPEVRRWMRDALTSIFKAVPGLGGVFTITASENATNCASHGQQEQCVQCHGRDYADILAEVNQTICDGVKAGNPEAKVIAWDWGWHGHGDATDVIARLPQDCSLMSVSEWSLPIERGGVKSEVGEYALSAVGPGPKAIAHWKAARKREMSCVAKVQAGTTWEIGSFPYLPVMDLVAQHAKALTEAEVDGLMLSWSLGCYPSPNLEVFQRFTKESNVETVLDGIAEDRYGKEAAPLVRKAWTAFSEAFAEFPFHIFVLYYGPQHVGPANPLYLAPTGYKSTMVGIPYDELGAWRGGVYPPDVWAAQMRKVAKGFGEGCAMFATAVANMERTQNTEHRTQNGDAFGGKDCLSTGRETCATTCATGELGMFRAQAMHFASCANQAEFIMARDRGDRDAMRRLAADEMALAQALLPLVLADSRIGYESSNQYFYTPYDVVEKIINCRHIIASL
ncbi:MAG: hypothetical protein FWF84_06905 [Kiritimatiellaeota bacterium]|nr:hypothetical protein [Kiritimatiellota bacterium]